MRKLSLRCKLEHQLWLYLAISRFIKKDNFAGMYGDGIEVLRGWAQTEVQLDKDG